MKRTMLQTITVAAFAICLTAISVQAQSRLRYQSHIPFDFTAGGQSFNAGDYSLTVINPGSDNKIFALRDLSSGKAQLLTTNPKASNPRQKVSQLVFAHVGGEYLLSMLSDAEVSVQFRQTKRTRRLAQAGAGPSRPETVAILMTRR